MNAKKAYLTKEDKEWAYIARELFRYSPIAQEQLLGRLRAVGPDATITHKRVPARIATE